MLLLLACDDPGKDAPETGDTGSAETETGDTGGTDDTAGESGGETDGDTGDTGFAEVGDDALVAWDGYAALGEGWVGAEAIVVVANTGLGDTLCRIEYEVGGVAPREDCADCLHAWDVVLGPATTTIEERCDLTGLDEAAIAALEGETRAYGVALDYLGHSNVLMIFVDGRWTAGSFLTWNETDETLVYLWEQDVIAY